MPTETYHCQKCGEEFAQRPAFCPNCENGLTTICSLAKQADVGQQIVEYGLYLVVIGFICVILLIGIFAFLVANLPAD